jgi:hypothetical protein
MCIVLFCADRDYGDLKFSRGGCVLTDPVRVISFQKLVMGQDLFSLMMPPGMILYNLFVWSNDQLRELSGMIGSPALVLVLPLFPRDVIRLPPRGTKRRLQPLHSCEVWRT